MKIVFISYLNRSGSTFLCNQLSKIPDICVCPEADMLYELLLTNVNKTVKAKHINKWRKLFACEPKFQSWKLSHGSIIDKSIIDKTYFEVFLKIILNFQKDHYPKANTIIFKQNFLYTLADKLPQIKGVEFLWISIIRNPVAMYSSQKNNIDPQTGKAMCNNPLLFIQRWNDYFQTLSLKNKTNANFMYLSYEDLISEFNPKIGSVLRFLKIEKDFSDFENESGRINEWLNEKYKSLHPNIEKSPQVSSLHADYDDLDVHEISIINRYICKNRYYPKDNSKSISNINLLPMLCYFAISKYSIKIKNLIKRLFFHIRY